MAYYPGRAFLMSITIKSVHPFAAEFPMMTDGEMDRLVKDIEEHGQIESCIVNSQGVLLDGRNRRAACERLGIEARVRIANPISEVTFIVSLNVARRHLNSGQLAVLGMKSLPYFESEARKRQGNRTNLREPVPLSGEKRARDDAGKALGVSGRYVQQAKRVKEHAPELITAIESGSMTLKAADREISKRKQITRELQLREAVKEITATGPRFDLRQGDFRTVLADIEDGTIDLILTDPPYGNDAIELYRELGILAARVLRPGGSLVTYVGQATLPECASALQENLRYWWTLALLHESGLQQLPGKWVQVRWKPLLWFVKEDRGGSRRYVDDVVHGSKPRKDLHEWAQGLDEVKPIIEQLTEPGALILDPFAGSATFGHAANNLGRHFIGADDGSHLDGRI